MARPLARRTGGFPGVTLSGRPGRHLGRGGGILRKCEAHWWGPRTSNPVYLLNKGVGGFDSHALPPTLCGAGGQNFWPPFFALCTSCAWIRFQGPKKPFTWSNHLTCFSWRVCLPPIAQKL